MKVIKTWNMPGKLNMALDAILAEICKEPILRFYTWARPTLSLGKHQKRIDLDTEFMREKNIDCVVRPTGGRAVLHWDELTYALVLPIDHPIARSSILESYLKISDCIAKALYELGFKVHIEPVKRLKENSAACFATPSSYEITIDGKKIVGSAQRRNEKSILQHGSIVLRQHTEEYAKCLKVNQQDLENKLAGLLEYREISIEELTETLQKQFEITFGKAEVFIPDQKTIELALKREEEFAWLES
ncbi:MAG TPA: biotin/lipoate A/B protein ligase family protein [Pseudothermotoga sp.]